MKTDKLRSRRKTLLKSAIAAVAVIAGVFSIFALDQSIPLRIFRSELPKMNSPQITIKKSERRLLLFDGEKLVKEYKIALGFEPSGDKQVEGDGKTPEGEFYIFTKNAESKFYLSLGVSYPSKDDAARGLEQSLISREEHDAIVSAIDARQVPPQKTKLGGDIYIHGYGNLTDWTEGCVAISNDDMFELFEAVPVGTPVAIEP